MAYPTTDIENFLTTQNRTLISRDHCLKPPTPVLDWGFQTMVTCFNVNIEMLDHGKTKLLFCTLVI